MQSRNEDILTAIADGTSSSQLKPPQSREEALLMRILDRVNDLGDLGGKFKVHICTSNEYDHITGIPTILGAEENTFYLVPSGSGTDMYKEWVYTNGNWELFGGGDISEGAIEDAVNDWLNDHPEATTTVQDGSISKAKLDSGLRGTVDDVDELESAINDIENVSSKKYFDGDIAGIATVNVSVDIPAGVYKLHIDMITSEDTDGTLVTFALKNGNNNVFFKNYAHDVTVDEYIYIPSNVTNIVCLASQYIADSAGDAFVFTGVVISADTIIKQFSDRVDSELQLLKDDCYVYTLVNASSTTNGYRLRGDGIRVADSNYKLEFYAVNEGDELKIVVDDKYQFQSNNSVPTSGLNANLKSNIYNAGSYLVKVPVGATYLVVSTLVDGQASVFSALPAVDDVRKGMQDYNIAKIGVTKSLKNLIVKEKCVKGSFNQSTGEIVPWNTRYITDYIPVRNGTVYRSTGIGWACYYDSEKQFIDLQPRGGILRVVTDERVAFVRLQIEANNIDTARFGEAKNWNKTDYNGYIYGAVASVGNQIIDQTYSRYAENSPNQFVGPVNLFDYINDLYFIDSKMNNDGSFNFNPSDSDIPSGVNAYISTFTYYPVQYGQVVCCNYALWDIFFYDDNKQMISAVHNIKKAVVPQNAVYARFDIKASNASPKPSDIIGNLSEMKNLMIYTVPGDQSVMPDWKNVPAKYQLDGAYVSANYLDKVVPSMADSEFLSAMKCMTIREINKRDHAFRFGNFNMWVMTRTKGWENTRRMLMDYGVDFCGFEEVYISDSLLVSKFMKSWQFPYGFDSNFTDGEDAIDKSFVSRYEILSATKFWTTSSGSSVAGLNCKIQLPRYADVYNPKRILSTYIVHLPITNASSKISVANEILALIAEDRSDFVMIFGDTNDFSATEEGKDYWRTFESAGFRPVIPIDTKTVTQDSLSVVEGDPANQWRHHSIDQFCVSSNIELVSYGVINTKDEYYRDDISGPATDSEPALSDHDFVYCDLRFKYDTPRSGLVT